MLEWYLVIMLSTGQYLPDLNTKLPVETVSTFKSKAECGVWEQYFLDRNIEAVCVEMPQR